MVSLKYEYQDDVILTGNGGVSEDLIPRVARVLEDTFGFQGVDTHVIEDVSAIKPFLDGEPRLRLKRETVEQRFNGRHVFVVQNSKVFDNRLEIAVRTLASKLGSIVDEHPGARDALERLEYLAYPNVGKSVAPRFVSSRFNPAAMEKQLVGQIYAARMGRARHISVVMPKTIFEWSHHFLEKWVNGTFEMPAYHDFLRHICTPNGSGKGADSIVIMHPHAPKEGLELARQLNLNFVMLYPQTYTLSSNGWIYSIDKLFEPFDLSDPGFDPLMAKINADREALGDLREHSHLLMYCSAPDAGSEFNAKLAAKRFNTGYVASIKKREEEGRSRRTKSDDIGDQLQELTKYTRDATIRVYIFDDMINSGGTANEEARHRKEQVAAFNQAHGTNYRVEVELIATHLRYPVLREVKHDHLDRMTIFDTVPYVPDLPTQLAKIGIDHKVTIIENTPHQLAMGIALEYFVQRLHDDLERDLYAGTFRETTDKDLVRFRGFGAELRNMQQALDGDA